MNPMRKIIIAIFIAVAVPAQAQIFQQPGTFQGPGQSPVIPYPSAPPRPAPPPVYVPPVPQMNSPPPFALQNTTPGLVASDPPTTNLKPLSHRKSFSKRFARCLNEGAAMGLTANERSSYARSCAQQ
ncbi:MAG: hypothetical protein K2X60_11680 [Xanthobacteraceae bacterium]|nr:hypothetical protein [Xanthobacteraceae bacterium]